MPARPEGRLSLLAINTMTVVLSSVAVGSFLYNANQPNRQPTQHSNKAETPPPRSTMLRTMGRLAIGFNFYLSQSLKTLESTTSTNQTETDADAPANHDMSIDSAEEKVQPTVSPTIYAEYYKVHKCEEPEKYDSHHNLIGGGWEVYSSDPNSFSGGLGIKNKNWTYYSTHPTDLHFPANAANATIAEQIIVDERIEDPPLDQDGCRKGGY